MPNPENLKNQQERMKNGLAAELGAKGGKARKGRKNLATIIKNIGEDIDWTKTTLKDREKLSEMYGNRAWEAITYVAFTQAMSGDNRARAWLSKNAFGDKIDITSDGERVLTQPIIISEIKSRNVTAETETEAGTDDTDNQ